MLDSVAVRQVTLLEMFREYELEELGRLHEEVMPKQVPRGEGRIKRSGQYKGISAGCAGTRRKSLQGTVWRRAFGASGAKSGW